jgi:general secretion pathway protein L
MNTISIDVGTYSLKILVSKLERSKLSHQQFLEIPLDYDQIDVTDPHGLWTLQLDTIAEFLKEINEEYRLVFNAPMDMMTFRMTSLPVNSLKKAQMMLPFKVEEDLPFSMSEAHYDALYKVGKTETKAFVAMALNRHYEEFYHRILKHSLSPRVITCEASSYNQWVKANKDFLPNNFAIIDIGHNTTHAHLFYGGELVETHTSYIAGKEIDEAIAENYQIDLPEAKKYKHENSFFLTKEQYEQVDEKQKVFGVVMSQSIKTLMHEIKRWDVGFRINQGLNIEEVFLTGGISKIKNIAPFLAEELGIKVSHLDGFIGSNNSKIADIEPEKVTYNTVSTLANSLTNRKECINFNKAPYSIGQQSDLPLKPTVFLATRMVLLSFIVVASLLVENLFFIQSDIKKANKEITSIIKNPTLAFSGRQKRLALVDSRATKATLVRKLRLIQQSVSTLQSAVDYNAMDPLNAFLNIGLPEGVYLDSFESLSHGEFTAVLVGKEFAQLRKLESSFRGMDAKDVQINFDDNEAKMTVMGVNL